MLAEPNMVERHDEVTALGELLAGAMGGSGTTAVLSGPVGSGKTEQLHQLTVRARANGAGVLSAIAARTEQDVPFGVVGQLLSSPGLPPHLTSYAVDVLDRLHALRPDVTARIDRLTAQLMPTLCSPLLRLSARVPLLLTVDDAHCADEPSLRCLSYLARRLRASHTLLVLAESSRLSSASALLPAGLLQEGLVRRVRLEPLSPAGIAELVQARGGRYATRPVAAYHALTGGSPLLLRALLEDARTAQGTAANGPLPVGEAYAEAALTCLYRCEPETRRVGLALALFDAASPAHLDAAAGRSLLPRLLGVDAGITDRAIQLLNQAGLLAGDRYRHPRARDAVLASIPAGERATLHARLARLLYHDGGPAAAIAAHLIGAEPFEAEWVVPVLLEAAESALTGEDEQHALACLRKALLSIPGDGPPRDGSPAASHRAAIVAMRARIRWRTNPADAVAHLPELGSAVRDGRLGGRQAVSIVGYSLWHGHLDQARELLSLLRERMGDGDPETRSRIETAARAMAYAAPEAAGRAPERSGTLAASGGGPDRGGPAGPDPTSGNVFGALYACVFTEPGQAWPGFPAPIPAPMPASTVAGAGEPPVWRTLLRAVFAEQALLRGDLVLAAEHGRLGLSELPPEGWGIAIGGLLATLIRARCAAGDYGAAAGYLRVPVPPGMYRTPFGLRYLHARAGYHLATGRAHASLSDLRACGASAMAWGLDDPEFLPWRTDLAEAHLRLGRRDEGERLVREQLSRLGPGQERPRAMAMRVLAATAGPRDRVPILEEAVDLARAAGDALGTAYALADLGRALGELGVAGRARRAMDSSRRLAVRCGAGAISDSPVGWQPTPVGRAGGPWAERRAGGPRAGSRRFRAPLSVPLPATLSDAELRVAVLASRGHSNREIADKLYLTISTVEQHLTRVYRKLQVSRREQLPSWLRAGGDAGPVPGAPVLALPGVRGERAPAS